MRVEFRKEGEGTGRVCGKEGVDLLGSAVNIGVEGGKDFFVLFGVIMVG